MERLTVPADMRIDKTPLEACKHCVRGLGVDVPPCGECQHERDAFDRLAAYENAGLSPEEVAGLAQVKREGRLVVLPPFDDMDTTGLKVKYRVYKARNGESVENCFVLRPNKDTAAWYALMEYARHTKNKQLAKDIRAWREELFQTETALKAEER